jgi:hypothetical protein
MMEKLALSDVIFQLRDELEAASNKAEGANLTFEVQDIDLELQVVVTREGKTGIKAKFWVLEANAEGKLGDAVTQKVRLKLKAAKGKAPLNVAGDDDKE